MTHLGSVAEYLADREGLTGTARVVFLRLLRDAFGFQSLPPNRLASVLLGVALTLSSVGIAAEILQGAGARATWPWLIVGFIGAVLARETARSDGAMPTVHHDFEWRAYCLLIRPVILRERPGLLDRNLADECAAEETLPASYGVAVRTVFREPGIRLWAPAAIGWLVGATAALSWRLAAGPKSWLLIFAVGGGVLGAIGWTIFRQTIFRRLQRAAREKR